MPVTFYEKIKGNVLNKILEDFRRFSNEDPTNVILQRFNLILKELGGVKMVKMINFIEEDDNDVKLSDLPFMKKKLAEKDAIIQEKDFALQEKDALIQKKDALIQQLLVQIK